MPNSRTIAFTNIEITTGNGEDTNNQEPKGPFAKAGALAGFGGGIWACIVYVKPFWDEQKGVNNDGAIALTVLTAVVGLSIVTGMGASIGNCIDKFLGSPGDGIINDIRETHINHYHHSAPPQTQFFTREGEGNRRATGDLESNIPVAEAFPIGQKK